MYGIVFGLVGKNKWENFSKFPTFFSHFFLACILYNLIFLLCLILCLSFYF